MFCSIMNGPKTRRFWIMRHAHDGPIFHGTTFIGLCFQALIMHSYGARWEGPGGKNSSLFSACIIVYFQFLFHLHTFILSVCLINVVKFVQKENVLECWRSFPNFTLTVGFSNRLIYDWWQLKVFWADILGSH